MSEQPVVHNTFVVERSYPVKPERVFAAFGVEGLEDGAERLDRRGLGRSGRDADLATASAAAAAPAIG